MNDPLACLLYGAISSIRSKMVMCAVFEIVWVDSFSHKLPQSLTLIVTSADAISTITGPGQSKVRHNNGRLVTSAWRFSH